MSPTGLVESWRDSPPDWGPVYPFVGYEGVLMTLCAAVFFGFMLWKFLNERTRYDKEVRDLRSSRGNQRRLSDADR